MCIPRKGTSGYKTCPEEILHQDQNKQIEGFPGI